MYVLVDSLYVVIANVPTYSNVPKSSLVYHSSRCVFGQPLRHIRQQCQIADFVTSDGEPYGPYGDPAAGKGFEIPMHKGAIVGFFAHSGGVLNSLGAYVGAQP
jgi:hypothetical protein